MADLTLEAREALEKNDQERLFRCINQNFDMRRKLYETLHIRMKPEHLEMVLLARESGASAKFAGSGGAIVGTCRSDKGIFVSQEKLEAKALWSFSRFTRRN